MGDGFHESGGDLAGAHRPRRLAGTALGCGIGALAIGLLVLGSLLLVLGSLAVWLSSCEVRVLEFEPTRGDGSGSARVAVKVEPSRDLVDQTIVTVTSAAFPADHVVGLAVCLEAVDTESAGVKACDTVRAARFAVAPDGQFSATYPVPRVITVQGRAHDCASPGTNCVLVAADARDYDLSGGQPLAFRTNLGPVNLVPATVRAESLMLPTVPPSFEALASGSTVEVVASGFRPNEPILLAHCAGFPARAATTTCSPVDSEAMNAVISRTVEGVTRHADPQGVARFTFTALPTVVPQMSGDGPVSCVASGPGCSFVVAAAADLQRSSVTPYTVAW